MAATVRTPLVIGDVIHDVRRVLSRRGLVLLLLSVALVYTSSAGAAWLRLHPPVHGTGFFAGLGNWLVEWLADVIPQSLFIATTCWTVGQVLEDRSPTSSDMLRQGLRFFAPMLAIQILYMLGVMAATLLLVVPGVILGLMWMVAPSALVIERLGIVDAFKRSRALTKGHRWALLGLIVAYFVVVIAIEWVVFKITSPGLAFVAAAGAPLNAFGVIPSMTVVTSLLSTTAIAALYMRLRSGHRGAADLTAEVFA